MWKRNSFMFLLLLGILSLQADEWHPHSVMSAKLNGRGRIVISASSAATVYGAAETLSQGWRRREGDRGERAKWVREVFSWAAAKEKTGNINTGIMFWQTHT